MHIVLNSFGASLRKNSGLFEISTQETKQMINPAEVSSISVSKGARISSDAVLLAIEHEVDVMFVDNTGKPYGRVWSVKFGSISSIRRKQLEFFNSKNAVVWVKEIVIEKINNQIALLLAIKQTTPELIQRKISATLKAMEELKRKVRENVGESVMEVSASMRGWEGAASKKYFESLSFCLPDEYKFEKRSRQPAEDRFNAMLNYGYGMLYGKVEASLIKAGIDPYLGVFHRDDYNRPALVFDIIEKFRIWVDYIVYHLCLQRAMSDECFTVNNDMVLLDGLGKRILIQSVNDYLDEIISFGGIERSRAEHINVFTHRLAGLFMNFKN
ncbi:CRISPR-associated endonuclease Cas1 [Saprospiraceae bacterium]|nr:CRISPR-associated endonuclease Cas1 [Saprospiraceae bacterium]HNO70861.1 CRISPR-associated endonuclease Cas1 [Bacteroidia bacterium]